ncbi:DUF5688 family protein [Pseudobutyrivibrio ruminis]|uniref:Uncharacterized protein n=1 Tax=Pseudobutyrivibrio ruminis DSM 9787 TaxID=1123011 RepID=A0A285T645_9FIRM|nr:DUF5688 family protein [Pseudobutyrivibrio ruminis]SOC16494.1 hypothetical protein SAMN02910411_0419 [Pseudobutyrivibrio ruminis DSM 9787]
MRITKGLIEKVNGELKDKGYFVEKTMVNKNNEVKTGLVIKKIDDEERMVCPTIYIGEMTCFDEVMRYALEVISREVPSIDMEHILDKEYILGHVKAQMVSAGNVILEPGVVYRDYLDMAIVYRVEVGEIDGGQGSFLIRDGVIEKVGLTEEDLFEVVNHDMRFDTKTLAETLANMMGQEVPFDLGLPEIYVVTSESMIHGAGVLCSEFLGELREKLEGDFFILPSSVHEILVLKDEFGPSAIELLELVKTVNATEVAPCDKLTDSVYKYDATGLSKVA